MPCPVYSSRQFSYSSDRKEFCTESSDLAYASPFGRFVEGFEQREGFIIESAKTGRKVRWHVVGVDRDSEGDIQAWILKSNDGVVEGHRVVVLND